MPTTFSAAYTGSAELLLPYLQYFTDPSLFTATKAGGPLVNQPGVLEAFVVTGVGRVGLITAQNGPFTTETTGSLCQADDSNPRCNVKLLLPTTRALNPALPTHCLQYQPTTGTFTLVSAGSAEVIRNGEGQDWVQCSIVKPGVYLAQQTRSIAPMVSNNTMEAVDVAANTSANDSAAQAPASLQPVSSPSPQLGQASNGSSSTDQGNHQQVKWGKTVPKCLTGIAFGTLF
jgi:hypothetical protein